jgi:hypothetical protein
MTTERLLLADPSTTELVLPTFNYSYIDQNGSILSYTLSISVTYLWFYRYIPDDVQLRPKHVVFLIWYNKQIDSLVHSVHSLII